MCAYYIILMQMEEKFGNVEKGLLFKFARIFRVPGFFEGAEDISFSPHSWLETVSEIPIKFHRKTVQTRAAFIWKQERVAPTKYFKLPGLFLARSRALFFLKFHLNASYWRCSPCTDDLIGPQHTNNEIHS